MKKIISLMLMTLLLSSCSVSDFTKPISNFWSSITSWTTGVNKDGVESLIDVDVVEKATSRSFFAKDDDSEESRFLNETIAVNAEAISLKELLDNIIPEWNIRIPEKFDDVALDVVAQTTRKQAIYDVLSQLNAQANFYTQTQPKPTLVIYEK
jgi:PBP1b-binding outer membrane lipoprotein LpoB